MTELFAASLTSTAVQGQMQTELFAMPEEIPLFDQIPLENLIIVKREDMDWKAHRVPYLDLNENEIPDGFTDEDSSDYKVVKQ